MGTGISFGSTNPPNVTVTGNTISGCYAGISVGCWGLWNNPFDTIQNNLIVNNSVGILINVYESGSGPYIENNTITDNTVGVQVAYSFGNNSPSLNYSITDNNIYGNANYNFKYQLPTNVLAIYNWWGTTDTQVISQGIYDYYNDFTLGKVTYSPFLTAANNEAPSLYANHANIERNSHTYAHSNNKLNGYTNPHTTPKAKLNFASDNRQGRNS